MSELADRLSLVQRKITQACALAGRSEDEVCLVVVTKNHSEKLVLDLLQLGVRDFGENRDQEAAPKAKAVREQTELDYRWHFIGQLQSNKARSMLDYSAVLHSLDRESLLTALIKETERAQRSLDVFIQLNLTEDPNRGGIHPSNLESFANLVLAQPRLNLLGVMGVASLDQPPEFDFERIQRASEKLVQLSPASHFISAGMSGDYEKAIEFGATHLRIGSAITGIRAA